MKTYIISQIQDELENLIGQLSLAEILGNDKVLLQIEHIQSLLDEYKEGA